MKRILSYALFQSPQPNRWRSDSTEDRVSAYARFLPVLVRAHQALWPGHELRIHHDDALRAHPYFEVLPRLEARGLLRLVSCGPAPALTLAMLWRMRPLFDEADAQVLTCDMDALPILRLRRMFDEWTASGKAAMLVHGCESHNGVLGGGFGAKARRFRELVGVNSWQAFVRIGGATERGFASYAADEDFLRVHIWPRLAHDAVVFRNNPQPTNISISDLRREPSGPPPEELLEAVRERGDHFAPYIGSAGYDLIQAFDFYAHLPLPAMGEIRACEGESLDLNRVMQP